MHRSAARHCPSKEWQGSGDTQQVFRSEGKCKLKEYQARSKGTERQGTEGVGAGFLREFAVGPRHVEAEPEAGLREAVSQWILTKKEEKVGRRTVRTQRSKSQPCDSGLYLSICFSTLQRVM